MIDIEARVHFHDGIQKVEVYSAVCGCLVPGSWRGRECQVLVQERSISATVLLRLDERHEGFVEAEDFAPVLNIVWKGDLLLKYQVSHERVIDGDTLYVEILGIVLVEESLTDVRDIEAAI